ncbi:hypothetical protein Y1Q_0020631 [Alligator mississippiensis]|uniref:Uncharacterized protein n=1 Tax=Alligator mississippiensis TaxID=8496 RepID=A0A151NH33_ALLMI|nr:hypothetical protein Y1Q_0020631 [Alligator mississippiensis]
MIGKWGRKRGRDHAEVGAASPTEFTSRHSRRPRHREVAAKIGTGPQNRFPCLVGGVNILCISVLLIVCKKECNNSCEKSPSHILSPWKQWVEQGTLQRSKTVQDLLSMSLLLLLDPPPSFCIPVFDKTIFSQLEDGILKSNSFHCISSHFLLVLHLGF